ncbi:prepilin peptidase [Haloarcula sp. S1CR25-12]|uniref:Prepilin peptidase n=1 Tax=Haloarcula saliterrae TaxID=2950534 RepID=A0ABU2FEE4_9EURY|nr:A24 family peptidase C-terminal domain-containing protein [Haloarcula sp. S1CR25-12]MDS0260091.1 prepilin peptidase [Haloarcula sp. S1CR25-12]
MLGSIPDLLRLFAVPVFGWAAYRDIETRRVPNRTWVPLAVLAVVLLVWDTYAVVNGGAFGRPPDPAADPLFFVQVAISLGFVAPLAYGFWLIGGFGGADAKAFMLVSVLFPIYPTYYLTTAALPLEPSLIGVFSLTILSNTVLAGVVYPLGVAAGNLARGRFSWAMFLGKPVPVPEIPEQYGRLLECPDGFTRSGLDLDALRMYLEWRGATLAALRADPAAHRDPDSLPDEPNPPGDGSFVTEGGEPNDVRRGTSEPRSEGGEPNDARRGTSEPRSEGGEPNDARRGTSEPRSEGGEPNDVRRDSSEGRSDGGMPMPEGSADQFGTAGTADPWGAERFLDDIEGSAYGTDAETLREGLELVVDADEVWVSPGIPFLVPMFVGLVTALVYGDVLYALLSALGFA